MYQLMLLLLLRLRRSSLSRAGSRCLWSHNVNMMICSSAFLVSEDASFPFIDPIGRVEPWAGHDLAERKPVRIALQSSKDRPRQTELQIIYVNTSISLSLSFYYNLFYGNSELRLQQKKVHSESAVLTLMLVCNCHALISTGNHHDHAKVRAQVGQGPRILVPHSSSVHLTGKFEYYHVSAWMQIRVHGCECI